MRTLVLEIEYDGTDYCGWQRQNDQISIQETIENSISRISGKYNAVVAAGRTDAGVHARAMIAHCKIDEDFSVPVEKIPIAINSGLNKDIRIIKANILNHAFHARFDAIAREYSYNICFSESVFMRRFSWLIRSVPDVEKLVASANIFIGQFDFTSYSKNNPEVTNLICNITKSHWQPLSENRWEYRIKADRFVYSMVRSIVGSMIDFSLKDYEIEILKNRLYSLSRVQSPAIAPANGLFFETAFYPDNIKLFN
ncbi:MAG: tRNA pseudouridine(38-40) synthase TruA [Candidatus Kapabacteria bacterium]|nr:tRNA pseudouridine(38-40) synthase TruA [Candidatus Kapabacteria bacterium]